MREVTAEELETVNGGNFEEFANRVGNMFQSWFGSRTPQNVSLTNAQATMVLQACIAEGGNASFRATQGSGSFGINAVRAGGSFKINGSNQSVNCNFYT